MRSRRHVRPRGYVMLTVLVLSAALFLLLDGAIAAHYALRQQNRRAARLLQQQCDQLRLTASPDPAADG